MSIGTNTPRLLAVAKEFNLGKHTLVEFLESKNFIIDARKRNIKLTPEMYSALQTEFAQDKAAKRRSDAIELPKPNSFRESNKIKSDANLGNIELKEVSSYNSSIRETGKKEESPFWKQYLLTQDTELNPNIPIENDLLKKEEQIEEQEFE